MEFRITGIEEIAGADQHGLGDKIVLSLENVQSENEPQAAGRYQPTAHITVTVPYDSEFYNAVIGMRVSFGVPPAPAIAPEPAPEAWDGSGRHYKHGHAPAGTPPELINPPVKLTGLTTGNTSWSDASTKLRKELAATEDAKVEIKKALPIIVGLMNNPTFVANVDALGYQFDVEAIFKAFIDASGWKSPVPIIKDIEPKQSELVEASTKSEEPVEPHYMVDYKKYPASYVEDLVRADVQRKAEQEAELEYQRQMCKALADMYKARAEFESQ